MKLSQRLAAVPLQAKSLPPKTIEFGQWLPDLPALGNPGATVANGVIPAATSYRPLPGLAVQSGALTAYCRGAAAAKTTAGDTYFYCGDATKLYSLRNGTVTDESGATYTTALDSLWRFVVFGTKILATNYDDPVQSITIGGAGTFADHFTSTEKPQARWIAVIGNFLVLGNINSTADGVVPNRVHWSAVNDSLDFDPDAATQCDFQDFPDGGHVQQVVGGATYGLVFQERQISRLTYEGSPLVFRVDPIDRQRGTHIPTSVIGHGSRVYFVNEEGFHFTDGAQTHHIGMNRVDTTFLEQFDPQYWYRVSAAVDPRNNLIVWSFPGSSGAFPTKLYFYNYETDRFAEADIETEIIVAAETQALDMDSTGTTADPDEMDTAGLPSLDSAAYQGGQLRFAAFDTFHRLCYFTGSNLAAVMETGEAQLVSDRRSKVRKVRSLVDTANATIAVASRDRLADAASFGSAVSMSAIGEHSVLNDGRYHRFRVSIPAGESWTHGQGVQAVYSPTGRK